MAQLLLAFEQALKTSLLGDSTPVSADREQVALLAPVLGI